MRYAFFLGCLIPTRLPQIELSSRRIFAIFDIEVTDTLNFLCCPSPFSIKPLDINTWIAIAARNLAVAEEQGLDILTLCPGCSSTLIEANHFLKSDVRTREKVNEVLKEVDKEYKGTVQVKHLLRVLYEDVGVKRISREVEKPLEVRVASHYGCHLLRPSELMNFDDVVAPESMDNIIDALGGESVAYENKNLCCGSALGKADEVSSLNMAREKLESIARSRADALCVVCPTCFLQFDLGQMILSRKLRKKYDVPVFYLSQLMGLALGLSEADIGAGLHKVPLGEPLEKMGGMR